MLSWPAFLLLSLTGEALIIYGVGQKREKNWRLLEKEKKSKNLGRLWLAYTELLGDFTCCNSYLLTLGTLHSQNSAYGGPIYTK